MTPMIGPAGFGWQEMLIILAIVLILFGGSRLAGLGKSTGRALREFKEETKGMLPGDKKDDDAKAEETAEPVQGELVDRPAEPQHHTTSAQGQSLNGQSTSARHDA